MTGLLALPLARAGRWSPSSSGRSGCPCHVRLVDPAVFRSAELEPLAVGPEDLGAHHLPVR
jgi:hypothetical protein